MKILMMLSMFLIIGGLLIIENNSMAIYEQDNALEFSKRYIEWLNQIYLNMQSLTLKAAELDWIKK